MVKRICALIFFVMILTGTAMAFEFSADMVMTAKDMKTEGKIFFRTDRFRMDMNSRGRMSVITRMDRKVVWNVMQDQRMYMEMPFSLKNKPVVEEKMEGEIERKLVGSETIDGHPTKKYLITYKSANRKDQVYQWLATDINFPVKTAAIDNSWMQEYRNVKIGPQPASLFEVPEGYKKLNMPAGLNFNMNRR